MLNKPSLNTLSRESVFCVYQREYANSVEHGRMLGSCGASSCFILALRDRISGYTVLSHIDSKTIDPVARMTKASADVSNIDVYIASALYFLDSSVIDSILSSLSQFRMVYCDLAGESYVAEGKSLVVDSETGDYFVDVRNSVFKVDEDRISNQSLEASCFSLMYGSELRKAK
jgi:hypothetical protein